MAPGDPERREQAKEAARCSRRCAVFLAALLDGEPDPPAAPVEPLCVASVISSTESESSESEGGDASAITSS